MATKPGYDVNRLSQDELEYEIVIRGGETGTVGQMRATLHNCRHFEREGRTLLVKKYPFSFEEDKIAVVGKIKEVSDLVAEFDGVPQTGAHRKLLTKLVHVGGRIENMPVYSDAESNFQVSVRIKVLTLEGAVTAKIKLVRRS